MTIERSGLPSEARAEKTDGRNVDLEVGTLSGEGAQQDVRTRDIGREFPAEKHVSTMPSRAGAQKASPDYYGQPLLKETVWTWMIPTYFFLGGMAGASSALSTALQLAGGGRFTTLERRLRYAGAFGDNVGAVLLIADLGRPSRFLNMMRVIRVSSPMNVGSWILSGSGACNTASALLARAKGPLKVIGDVAAFGGGLLGMPLSGYTGVLLANTAVPVWQAAHRTLPATFMASGAASAASAMQLFGGLNAHEERALSLYGALGKVAELATAFALEKEASRHPLVAHPLKTGFSGALWKSSKVLTAASLALSLLPNRRRSTTAIAGALGLAGSMALRWAIFQAGKRSARDPQASFQSQRAGLGGAESTGRLPALGPASPAREVVQQPTFKLPVLR